MPPAEDHQTLLAETTKLLNLSSPSIFHRLLVDAKIRQSCQAELADLSNSFLWIQSGLRQTRDVVSYYSIPAPLQ